MNYRIYTFPSFAREVKRLSKRYKSLKSDLLTLANELQTNPTLGVDLGGGLRKVRMAIPSKGQGKSGGARVITLVLANVENGIIAAFFLCGKLPQVRKMCNFTQN